MNKEKKFARPEAEVIEFNSADVILTSVIGGIGEGSIPGLDTGDENE